MRILGSSRTAKCPECNSFAWIIGFSGAKDSGYQFKYTCSNRDCTRHRNAGQIILSENFSDMDAIPQEEFDSMTA